MEQRRLRHDVATFPAGTVVEVVGTDTDPEYAVVKLLSGLTVPIHWDDLDPVDEPYGDTDE